MLGEFLEFLRKYGIIGLAIAVIIGGKLNALVTALVEGIVMPVITFFVPGGDWRAAKLDIGRVHLVPGPALGALLDFVIVAFLVFIISRKLLKEEAKA